MSKAYESIMQGLTEAVACKRMETIKDIDDARLRELCAAERDGRVVVLPCKIGDTVYTVEEQYFQCEDCEFGKEAYYHERTDRKSCDDAERHCPLTVEAHTVQGFNVDAGGASDPGEWGYEGLERFSGRDGKWHKTAQEAEEAAAALAASAGKGE